MIRKFILGCFVGTTLVALSHSANAGSVNFGGYAIKYGSVDCTVTDGTGGVNENKDFFQCAVTGAYANVLCVNSANNNGNPYTASAQLADLFGDARLSVDREKKYWNATALVDTDSAITNAFCVNANWNVVTLSGKPVYAITSMDVTLKVLSCNPKDVTCLNYSVKATLPLTCAAPTTWDVNFTTVELNSDGTASKWPGAPQAGQEFVCYEKP